MGTVFNTFACCYIYIMHCLLGSQVKLVNYMYHRVPHLQKNALYDTYVVISSADASELFIKILFLSRNVETGIMISTIRSFKHEPFYLVGLSIRTLSCGCDVFVYSCICIF